jgi:hypothetical protein
MQQQTCGAGLAANSVTPRLLADFTAAMAGLHEAHLRAVDAGTDAGRRERETYAGLARRNRNAAALLQAASDEMSAARDLPPAPHDMAVMTDGVQLEAFEKVVRAKQALLAFLQETAERDQSLLEAMRQAVRR